MAFSSEKTHIIVSQEGMILSASEQLPFSLIGRNLISNLIALREIKTHSVVSPCDVISGKISKADLYLTTPKHRFFIEIDRLTLNGEDCLLITLIQEVRGDSNYLALPKSERLNTILESCGAGAWEWNIQTGELVLSEHWASMLGYRLNELSPLSIHTLFGVLHPDDRAISEDAFDSHFAGEDDLYHCEVRLRHKHGHFIWVRDFGRIVSRSADGVPEWISGAHIDISEYKQSEQQLRLSQKTLQTAQEIARLGHWQLFPSTSQITWSAVMYEMLGLDADSFEPTLDSFRSLLHPEDESPFDECLDGSLSTRVHDVVHRIRHAAGHYIWVHEYAQWQNNGETLIGTMSDVTQQKELEIELLSLSRMDALTGLANRRFFVERVEKAISQAMRNDRPLSLLIVDVDHFKQINDNIGHDGGDEILQSLSRCMSKSLRKHDTLARIGGEEFAALLPDTTLAGARAVAEKLKNEANSFAFEFNNGRLDVTVTVGFCSLSEDCADWSTLYSSADKAMYAAKKNGRNRVFGPS